MAATTATATTSRPTIRSAGSSATCRTTSRGDASTCPALRASRPTRWPAAWPRSPRSASPSPRGERPTSMTDVRVEAAEMRELVETLGAIGEQPGGGIVRPVYSPAWVAAREQLATWLRDAGLQVRVDAVGNLFGRLEGDSPRTVLTGSHFDTVKLGGRYDGALGVLSALAAVRALRGQQFVK